MKFPPWAIDNSARIEYLLRTAAAHHNREASIPTLATACGFSAAAFTQAISRGYVSPGMAASIELAVRCDLITKDLLLRPAQCAEETIAAS
jgi:hypothetical protein